MTAIIGRQLIDAGDEQLPLWVVGVLAAARRLVVIVQPGGLGRRGADHGDRHVEPSGQRVDRRRAGRPGQVPGRGQGVDRGPGQPAAAGHRPVRPAAVMQPLLDQPLQRVDVLHWHRLGTGLPLSGKIRPAIRRMHRHVY
jgi:hypothetical protein